MTDDRRDPTVSRGTRLEDAIASCLEEIERFDQEALDRLCAAHPAIADELRAQFEELRAGGLAPAVEPSFSWQAESPATTNATQAFEPIGPYRPLRELGRGGQGVVYLAEDTRLGRTVALKVLKGFGAISEVVIRRFRREAEVASKLDHPGICAVYDADVAAGISYIAMHYVEGKTLADRINEAKSSNDSRSHISFVDFDSSSAETANAAVERADADRAAPSSKTSRDEVLRAVGIAERAARALHAAHEAGVIHRDVKPGNIMVTPAGDPVLLDFGLAGTEQEQVQSLTRTGDLFGTPAYMSPEQLLAKRVRLDRRTDIYSLAVTLYECVTLERPFDAPTREAMYEAINFKEARPARQLNKRVPADLEVVLVKAMEKDRDRRYATAQAFAEDLQRVRAGEPVAARRVGAAGRAVRYAKRRPARAALALLLAVGFPVVTALAGYIIANLPNIQKQRQAAIEEAVESHLQEGFAALTGGPSEATRTSFEKAAALKPDSIEAFAGRIFAHLRMNRAEDALALLASRPDLVARSSSLGRLESDALRALGRKTTAAVRLESLAEPGSALDCWLEATRLQSVGLGGHLERGEIATDRILSLYRCAVLMAPRARLLYHESLARALSARSVPRHQ